MDRNSAPIGVFDSGLGGMTVLKAIMARLPDERLIYFGDSGRYPYGTKSRQTVIHFAQQIIRFLNTQDVKLIVIACNTASAAAYETVRDTSGVPVVEVVSPGSVAAAAATRNRRIGIIGTRGTVDSGVYPQAFERLENGGYHITQQACPLFVGLAEEGWWDLDVTRRIAEIYLEPLLAQDIDTLILGCTHYALLSGAIGAVCGPEVTLIDAGEAVAEKTAAMLAESRLLAPAGNAQPSDHRFYTSDSVDQFRRLGSAFLGSAIGEVARIDIERY